MSKTKISMKSRRELWFRAAGRCEFKGCNEPLDRHGITMDTCDCSECAHIIADSPDGPRGDAELSNKLAQDIDNIMLMCPKCHKLVENYLIFSELKLITNGCNAVAFSSFRYMECNNQSSG